MATITALIILLFFFSGCNTDSQNNSENMNDDNEESDDSSDDGHGNSDTCALTPGVNSCLYTFNWLLNFNIFVFGKPDLDYLLKTNGSVITWSVYYGGYNDEEHAYVEQLHNYGIKVDSNYPTMQANMEVAHDEGLIERSACKDIWGFKARSYWILPDPPYLPCHNNPEWQNFLRQRLHEHIDGDVDSIHFDEPEGIGGHLYLFGFCEYCMAGFREYLKENYTPDQLLYLFDISNADDFDYRIYLLSHGAISIIFDPNPLLRKEFVRFQLVSRKKQLTDLIAEGRQYSGNKVAFSANTIFLGANKHSLFSLFDFIAFENSLEPPTTRGRYLGTYFLGQAVKPCMRIVMLPHILDLAVLSEEDWRLFPHWLSEASASQGGFLLPYHMYTFGGGQYHIPPEQLQPYTDFVKDTSKYTLNAQRVVDAAVLYDYNGALEDYLNFGYFIPYVAVGKTHDGFRGLSLALQELHILFDVVYEGDGDLVEKQLTLADLAKYPVVLVPKSSNPTGHTQKILEQYTNAGGTVIELGDIPRQYWNSPWKAELRVQIYESIMSSGKIGPYVSTVDSERIGMVLYRKSQSLVLHILNYDFQYSNHDFADKTNIQIDLALPPGFNPSGKTLQYATPEGIDITLPYGTIGNRISFSVPSLHNYGLIVLGKK